MVYRKIKIKLKANSYDPSAIIELQFGYDLPLENIISKGKTYLNNAYGIDPQFMEAVEVSPQLIPTK